MTNNKQQTAVEWLSEKVLHREWELLTQEKKRKILEQAKEMQKEQAIKLHYEYELYVMMNESDVMTFGQFYKQTYGGGEQ
jgi:TorA maturation chaperone TorD